MPADFDQPIGIYDSSVLGTFSRPISSRDPQAQAYFNGPFASQTDGMLAGYNPLSGPLLASSDAASTYAGVYGPAGYSLNADQAAVVRSLQGETPWLGSGEWSSNIPASGWASSRQ